MSNISIVTAFFDIGRSNWYSDASGQPVPHYIQRSTNSYFDYFQNLAKMKNDMIIYCADEHEEVIENIRKHSSL